MAVDTLEYDHTTHTTDAGDAKLYVQFYQSILKNESRSKEEGRPMYDDVPYIKIFTPGDRTSVIDRPIRETDKFRFPAQWNRFSNSQEQRADGTPLAEWPIISRSQAEELKFFGFQTVEQIADAKDGINMMGINDLKNKAKVYLELAKGNTAPIEQMSARQKELETQNKILTENMEIMRGEIKELTGKLVKKA